MPVSVEQEIDGYAFCVSQDDDEERWDLGQCPGHVMEPARLVRTETSYLYGDFDGWDWVGGKDPENVERSSVTLRFVDEAMRHCVHCDQPNRQPSETPHVSYPRVSGQDPMHLRRMGREARLQREATERAEVLRREELELRRQELEARYEDQALVRAQVQALTEQNELQTRRNDLLEAKLFGSNGNDADEALEAEKPARGKR